jgi:hypothetical protein
MFKYAQYIYALKTDVFQAVKSTVYKQVFRQLLLGLSHCPKSQ